MVTLCCALLAVAQLVSEVNRRYFESLMQDKDLSLRGLAKLMDMSHSQLSLTFSGTPCYRHPQLTRKRNRTTTGELKTLLRK